MRREGLLIGEVAAKSGVSRKALRLYEKAGILPPPRRTESGYRVYSSETLGLLAFVAQARRRARVTDVSEAGSVPFLTVANRADRPLLLLDGEELIGAMQTSYTRSSPPSRLALTGKLELTQGRRIRKLTQPYWRLAIATIPTMPTISWTHRAPVNAGLPTTDGDAVPMLIHLHCGSNARLGMFCASARAQMHCASPRPRRWGEGIGHVTLVS
jgi:hypothetical protein